MLRYFWIYFGCRHLYRSVGPDNHYRQIRKLDRHRLRSDKDSGVLRIQQRSEYQYFKVDLIQLQEKER